MISVPEGFIKIDSDFGKEIGFTSLNFAYFSYLWGVPKENLIYISMICSKKSGEFKQMMKEIERRGINFRIPTPLGRM
jgi:hypothetical protein